MLANPSFGHVAQTYLFSEIARRVERYRQEHPDASIIRLGIGDVTLPLPQVSIKALHEAADEMGKADTFRGYGPEQGYAFLREAIAREDFQARGCDIEADEILVSDGAKSDTANFTDLFARGQNEIGIPNPVYPVYLDSNVMAGHAGLPTESGYERITFLPCLPENGFKPRPPQGKLDIVYLCSPNNPTGGVLTRAELTAWVEWAKEHQALILFDAAYEAFIRDDDLPHSIYEIPGAKEVAVEFRSFSKTAGFTGLRCAYTVVPKTLMAKTPEGDTVSLQRMWLRRQTTKFNGVPYVVQRAAAALYSPEGKQEIKERIDLYLQNAALIRNCFVNKNMRVFGGEHAPYVWLEVPQGMDSWGFFDLLLDRFHIVGTPGSGFGRMGEGYFRLTGFGSPAATREAVERIKRL